MTTTHWLDSFVSKNAWVILVAICGLIWWGAYMTVTVKNIAANQAEMLDIFKSVEKRYGELALKINTLEERIR